MTKSKHFKPEKQVLIQVGRLKKNKFDFISKIISDKKNENIFIFDTFNQFTDAERIFDVSIFLSSNANGIFRYVPEVRKQARLDLLEIIDTYKNGMLIINDFDSLFKRNPITMQILLRMTRTRNVDIIINYHSNNKHFSQYGIVTLSNLYIFHNDVINICPTIKNTPYYELLASASLVASKYPCVLNLDTESIHLLQLSRYGIY